MFECLRGLCMRFIVCFINSMVIFFKGWRNILDRIYKKVGIEGNIMIAFFVTMISLLLTHASNGLLNKAILVLFLPSFAYLVCKSLWDTLALAKQIRKLKFYDVEGYKKDHKRRMGCIANIISILYGLLLVICYVSFAFTNSTNSKLIAILIAALIFSALIYVLIRFYNPILTAIIIFASSIPGLFCTLITATIGLGLISAILDYLSTETFNIYSTFSGFRPFSDLIILVLLTPKYQPFLYISLLISLVIQLLIIFVRPPYLISKTKSAFKLLSITLTIATMFLVLYSANIKEFFINAVNPNVFNTSSFKDLAYYFKDLDSNTITESFVQRIISINSFPYTIGSIVCLFIIECKENIQKKLAKRYYYNALYYNSRRIYDKALLYLKKSLLFGNDLYEFAILNNNDFKIYLEELGYNEHMKTQFLSEYKSIAQKLKRIIYSKEIDLDD